MKLHSLQPFFRLFAGVVLIAALLILWLFYNLQPASNVSTQQTLFVIPKGQSTKTILSRLQEAGIIRSATAMDYYLYFSSQRNSFQAGSFRLSPSMTLAQIIEQLQHGTLDTWVTIPEGWRAEEISDAFKQALGESFDAESFTKLAKAQEGYLFPDTYLVTLTATPEDVLTLLTRTFAKKIATLPEVPRGEQRPSTNVMILASIVERESKTPEDRKIVAGILWKRLDNSFPLQVDATLQYAKGYNIQKKTWWSPPTAEDKKINSPFNTYKYPGLPPHPISNPGLEAIRAALFPTKTEYLYYLSEDDGTMHYAKTLEGHNANIATYLR